MQMQNLKTAVRVSLTSKRFTYGNLEEMTISVHGDFLMVLLKAKKPKNPAMRYAYFMDAKTFEIVAITDYRYGNHFNLDLEKRLVIDSGLTESRKESIRRGIENLIDTSLNSRVRIIENDTERFDRRLKLLEYKKYQ